MEVSIPELRKIADKLFSHLEKNGTTVVDIPHDFYWYLSEKNLYDPYITPSEFEMGQLTDDSAELKRILNGEAEPVAFGLVWLASILRAIGEKLVA